MRGERAREAVYAGGASEGGSRCGGSERGRQSMRGEGGSRCGGSERGRQSMRGERARDAVDAGGARQSMRGERASDGRADADRSARGSQRRAHLIRVRHAPYPSQARTLSESGMHLIRVRTHLVQAWHAPYPSQPLSLSESAPYPSPTCSVGPTRRAGPAAARRGAARTPSRRRRPQPARPARTAARAPTPPAAARRPTRPCRT